MHIPRSFSRLLLAALLSVPLVLSACGGDDDGGGESQTTITVSGAFALYPLVVLWAEEYHALHADVVFDVSAGGAGKGMSDVLSGAADVAMVSRRCAPRKPTRARRRWPLPRRGRGGDPAG